MKVVELLDKPLFSRTHESGAMYQSTQMVSLLPTEPACLSRAYEVLVRLNSEEIRRFDAWTRKAGSMLAASGLILSLCSLGLPRLLELQAKGETVYLLATGAFVLAIGAFFLATWSALVSIRRRPYCVVDESCFCDEQNKPTNHNKMLLELASSELAAYRNNMIIVNKKGTKVNQSYGWFFFGCICEAVFVLLVVVGLVCFGATRL